MPVQVRPSVPIFKVLKILGLFIFYVIIKSGWKGVFKLDFRQLETFIEVVNNRSFSKAAKKLFLSQPTVTSHIQALEDEYDTILLNRFGRTVTTTGAGEILYKKAIEIINMVSSTSFDLGKYKGKVQGHLRISSSSIPRDYIIPKLLKDFMKSYPDINFTISDKNSLRIIDDILSNETDFGILGVKIPSKYIEYVELKKDKICLITESNTLKYPFNNGDYIDKELILSEHIILRESSSGTRHIIESLFLDLEDNRNFEKKLCYIEGNETIKKFVEYGLGISFISKCSVEKEIKAGTLKYFYLKDYEFERSFYFAYHNKRELSPLSKLFKDFILENTK